MNSRHFLLASLLSLVPFVAAAQPPPISTPARPDGTVVLMTGTAELEVANDEALASFHYEAQDADPARAQTLVNQRVAEGVAALKRADPKAQVETAGYGSYPIYSRDGGRKITGWRVRQSVNFRTSDLGSLPRAVAAGQQQLVLSGIDFRLSRGAREKVEGELIQRSIANLNARVAAAAQAMDVAKSRIRIEELNFGVPTHDRPPIVPMARMQTMTSEAVSEPQLDAGRSMQQMTVTGRVRFLAN